MVHARKNTDFKLGALNAVHSIGTNAKGSAQGQKGIKLVPSKTPDSIESSRGEYIQELG